MRKRRYTDEQMVKIHRETDRSPVAEVAKTHGGSEQTLYVWRTRVGTMTADDTKRLRVLEQENGRLKKLVGERDLEIEVMKEIGAKQWEARPVVARTLRTQRRAASPRAARARSSGQPGQGFATTR